MKKFPIFILALTSFFAAPVGAENLLDLYNLAKEYDPIMQAAYQDNLAKLEKCPQAIAELLPKITATSVSTNATRKSNEVTTKGNSGQNGFSIRQPLFQMDVWSKLSQAKDTVRIAYAELAAAEQELLFRIANQYFAILKAQDNLSFLKAQQKAFSKQLEQTRQRYKVGLVAITDVHEAQAGYDSAFADVIQAENDLLNTKEKLKTIVGQEIAYLAPLKADIALHKPNPTDIGQWVTLATEKNWLLQIARHNLEIARKKIRENKAGHYPSLQLTADVNRWKYLPPSDRATTREVGVQLNVPIFSGGSVISKTREASYNYTKATEDLELQYRTTEFLTKQSYNGVLTKLSQIKAFKQAVISNTSAFRATQSAFEVGNRTVVDVLNAQSKLINAEKNHAQARYDYILQGLTLKQVSGILAVEDLVEVNGLLKS